MMPEALLAAMEATWPAAHAFRAGPWMIRDGAGGGKRVSAATAEAVWGEDDLAAAEAAMAALGQAALYMIRAGEEALDRALASRGYRLVDPVVLYAAPLAMLSQNPPDPMSGFTHWPPLAIAAQLWADAGIGPARLAVMGRVQGPKAAILARSKDQPSGVAFVAMAGGTAVLHALEVTPARRRQGSARNILRAAAVWAQEHGADRLALAVTDANAPARQLYSSFGMAVVGYYHYRQK
jgi:GNAT superfamily N-acetyltransferase